MKESFRAVREERNRQDKKWGYPQHHTLAEWLVILAEERGEVDKEINEVYFRDKSTNNLLKELVEEAAVILAIYDAIWNNQILHRGKSPDPLKLRFKREELY